MTEKKVNYSKELDKIIERNEAAGEVPSVLLQACCAPCSSHCLEYLREHFAVTVFYYNPNISEYAEYERRKAEEIRLIAAYNRQVEEQDFAGMHSTPNAHRIGILDCPYDGERFEEAVEGLEDCPEGGERCGVCFALRLAKTAETAAALGFDFFSTTLTISPMKDAQRLNRIGSQVAQRYGVAWLPSDFKKKDGYLRSIELSREFDLYRQNYCGCRFSREEACRREDRI